MRWMRFPLFISCLFFFSLTSAYATDFGRYIAPPPPGVTQAMRDAVATALDAAEHSYRNEMAKYKHEVEISESLKKAQNEAKNAATKAKGKAVWQKAVEQSQNEQSRNMDNAEVSGTEFRNYFWGREAKYITEQLNSIASRMNYDKISVDELKTYLSGKEDENLVARLNILASKMKGSEISGSEVRTYLSGLLEERIAKRLEALAMEPEHVFTATLYKELNAIFEIALASRNYEEARAAEIWRNAIVSKIKFKEDPASLDEYEEIAAKNINYSYNLGYLYTLMGNYNKAARYFLISLIENPAPGQLESLCNKKVQEEKEKRELTAKLLESINKQKEEGQKATDSASAQLPENHSQKELIPQAPEGTSAELIKSVKKALEAGESQYRNYLANKKIDFQIANLRNETFEHENEANTKEEKERIKRKFFDEMQKLNATRMQNSEISEAEFQEFLNEQLLTPEAMKAHLSQMRYQKKAISRQIALTALQTIFEKNLVKKNLDDAKAAATWQFAIAHSANPNVYTGPDNEYSLCQTEVIPYHKNLGQVYTAMGNWPKALKHFGINIRVPLKAEAVEALCIAASQAAKNNGSHFLALAQALTPYMEEALNNKDWDLAEKIGLWQVELANRTGSKENFGLQTFDYNAKQSGDLGEYYHSLGLALKLKGNINKAKEYFNKSLAPNFNSKSIVNTNYKAWSALDLALIEKEENDPLSAYMHSSKAWAFWSKQPKINVAYCRDALRLMIWSGLAMGEYAKALQAAETLVGFLAKLGEGQSVMMAEALDDLASVQNALGNTQSALLNMESAQKLYQTNGKPDAIAQANILMRLYALQKEAGRDEPGMLEQAIKLTPDLPPLIKAKLHLLLGDAQEKPNQKSKDHYKKALGFAKEALKAGQNDLAEANLIYGDLSLRQKQIRLALPALQNAFYQFYNRQAYADAARCAYLLAKAYADLDQNRSAIFWGKICINTIQETRAQIRNVSPENQQSFINAQQNVYQDVIALLQKEGRILEAAHIYSLLKKEEIRQLFREKSIFNQADIETPMVGLEQNLETLLLDTMNTLNGVQAAVNMAERWGDKVDYNIEHPNSPIRRLLAGVVHFDENKQPVYLSQENQALMRKMLKSQKPDLNYERHYPEEIEISPYVKDNLRKRLETEKSILHGFFQAIPETLASWDNSDNLKHFAAAVANLDDETALLHVITTADNLWLWLTGNRGKTLKIQKVPVSRNELRHHVVELRNLITQRKLDPRPKSKELYDLLIKPIEEDLQILKPRTLLFSLDNVLRYIPPAVLYDGNKWLLEDYAIGLFLEASSHSLEHKTENLNVGALGLSEQRGDFPPLPGVERELESIVQNQDNPDGIIPGEIYLNDDFTEKSLTSVLKDNVSLLHVATHFKLDPKSAADSFLLLGDGSKLPLTRLTDKSFNFENVRHISLSACETGLRPDSSGCEIESLGSLVQEKGAQSVIATLWPISDAATSILMPLFYKNILEGKSRTEALRQAQLTLIKENWEDKLPASRGSKYPRLRRQDLPGRSHPYYWAPYILMGNWQ